MLLWVSEGTAPHPEEGTVAQKERGRSSIVIHEDTRVS